VCYCAHLPHLPTRARVVFIQHPRERRVPIGTARMAHLALPNSEFHVGVDFEGDPRIEALADRPGTFLLFPDRGAREVDTLAPGELRTLVVVDGTWPLARKLIKVNATLRRIPTLAFRPERPGNYRIRREPAAHCLSTIEAVCEVFGYLEGDPERFRRMLGAFEAMVDAQLRHKAARTGPSRYRRSVPRRPSPAERIAAELRSFGPRLVLVYAESNALACTSEGERRHELLHLVAVRPAMGERFEALLAPGGELDPTAPHHLELPAEALRAGEDRSTALSRWSAFVRPGDVLAGWGHFTHALVKPHAFDHAYVDLRERTMRAVKRHPRGLDDAPAALGVTRARAIWARGRAGRRIAALDALLTGLLPR
jgi:DTW domain-containing protein YfiP